MVSSTILTGLSMEFCNTLYKFFVILMHFRSANFFRRTMHSKTPVVNLAKQHETLLPNKWLAVCNRRLFIIHCFYFDTIPSKYKWFYHFITQVIFRYFFNVGIGNELLQVCHNFIYPIQCTKLILSILYGVSVIEVWLFALLANVTKDEKFIV